MRAATHGCNEGSIEAGWLGQSHLPVMLNYVPTTQQAFWCHSGHNHEA